MAASIDTLGALRESGYQSRPVKQEIRDKLAEHKRYIYANGQDMPEILNWKWEG